MGKLIKEIKHLREDAKAQGDVFLVQKFEEILDELLNREIEKISKECGIDSEQNQLLNMAGA